MRKRKPKRQPIPARPTWSDRLKVAHHAISGVFTLVKMAEWVWLRWPFN